MKFNWKLFAALSTLTGTIVGAGFLGIPYVVAKSGFIIGFFQIIFISLIFLAINLYLGEILLRTEKTHQLPGLAKIYLGKIGYKVMFFSMLFSIYSALVAYLIGEGESLSYFFTNSTHYTLHFALGFWIILSFLVYRGIRALKKGESVGIIFVFSILFLILIYSLNKIKLENVVTYNFKYAFLPVGVIMFAFLGFSAIPEVLRELKRNENLMKKAIIIGSILPIFIYCLFTFFVISVFGSSVPEIATFALGKIFVLLGIFTIFTAFFSTTMATRDIYRFDLNYSAFKSWFLSCFIPLVLFLIVHLLKLVSFVELLGIGGTIGGGLSGILILLMIKKARKMGKRKPEYKIKLPSCLIWILIIFLIAGLVFQLIF